MPETTFAIQIPEKFLQFGFNREEIQRRVTEWMALSFFAEDRISSGQAARLLHISRVEFWELLKKRGIAYINYTPEELTEEFETVHALQVNPTA